MSHKNNAEKAISLAQLDIADIFHGQGVAHGDRLLAICEDFRDLVERFIDGPIDLTSPPILTFLRSTLPRLVETFLRRKTLREHASNLAKLFASIVRLLALADLQCIPELSELRNALLGGNNSLIFVTPEELRIAAGTSSGQNPIYYALGAGFFGEHGKPAIAYKGGMTLYFWPDEWEKELAGINAIGHFLSIYNPEQHIWRNGEVINYDEHSGAHIIKFDTTNCYLDKIKYPNNENNSNSNTERIYIDDVLHEWIDSSNRDRLQPEHKTSSNEHEHEHDNNLNKLSFTQADIGKFVRIWWSRYQRHFYGCIIKYDPVSKQHCVVYDDGDTRMYDMESRLYDILHPPDNLNLQSARSHAEAASLVSHWHLQYSLSTTTNSSDKRNVITNTTSTTANTSTTVNVVTTDQSTVILSGVDGGVDGGGSGDGSNGSDHMAAVIAVRPDAALGYSTSIYLVELINIFYNEGGFVSMFHNMIDSSYLAPNTHIILSYLRLLCQLRQRILHSYFRKLVWEAKESIPIAILRYEDIQIKDLNRDQIYEISIILKDLIAAASSSRQINISESIDTFFLCIASKLLRCSQLQKRYLGLSIIKETIEFSYPRITANLPLKNNNSNSNTNSTNRISINNNSNNSNNLSVKDTVRVHVWNPSDLGKWLVEQNVIESIFGNSLHQDLAAKSDVILVFMAIRSDNEDKFNSAHYETKIVIEFILSI
eukprot:gene5398-10794_t